MKTLKESILNRSSHTGEGFKAQRRELIESWLKEYNIQNYTINDDFTIDVNGNVNLGLKDLSEFPDYIQFRVVKNSFDCSYNHLKSLRGVPKEVGDGFYCYNNQLITLKGSPEIVKKKFNCSDNKLTTLEGAPKEVGGDFDCSDNKVKFTKDDVRKVCKVGKKIVC